MFLVGLRHNFANFVRGERPMGIDGRADMRNFNSQGTLVMEEKFETIKGFGAKYIVSNFGRVFSNGKELKPGTNNCGYKYVILCNNGTRKKMYVHRLVADAFVENENGYNEINHIDENKANNNWLNLCWCSHVQNSRFATRGLRIAKALRNGKASKSVLQFDKLGNLVKQWPSVMEIERVLGFCHSSIAACCRGENAMAYNFKWEYANG